MEKVLFEVRNRSNGDAVRIIEKDFEGRAYVDFRVWTPNGTIESPTRKGFFLTRAEWEILQAQIVKSATTPAEYSI